MTRTIKISIALSLLIIGLSSQTAQSANISNGSKCLHRGSIAKASGQSYKCLLKNSILTWQSQNSSNLSNTQKKPTKIVKIGTWFKAFTQPGIFAETCTGDSNANLEIVDPTTGKVRTKFTFHLSMANPTLGDVSFAICGDGNQLDGASNLQIRQQFTKNFSKVAFSGAAQSDGSVHVGFLDLATNKFTDVTSLTRPTGFGQFIPVDLNPMFDPDTGQLCFRRTSPAGRVAGSNAPTGSGEINCYNAITKSLTRIGTFTSYESSNFLTKQSGIFVSGDHMVSPDGSEFTLTAPSVFGRVLFVPTTSNIDSYAWFASNALPKGTYFNDPFFTLRAEVFSWLGNASVLISIDNTSGLYTVPATKSSDISVTPLDLLPVNNATNSNAIISPDQNQIAFIHTLSLSSDLYIASIDPGSAPKKILTDFNARMIDWQ